MNLSSKLAIASIATVSSAVAVYFVYNATRGKPRRYPDKGPVTSDGFLTIRLQVPKDLVGAIIGKQGSVIKKIQAETKTKVDFGKQGEETGKERTITIRGSEKGVHDAEMKILHIVYEQPNKITKTMKVPQKCVGKIIGSGGSTITLIQSETSCRVKVDSGARAAQDSDTPQECEITFHGEEEHVAAAMSKIQEIVEQYELSIHKSSFLKSRNQPRATRHKAILPSTAGGPLSAEMWPAHDDFIQVYVTATENPEHIWVQPLTPQSYRLEEINTNLNELYSSPDHQLRLADEQLPIGTVVAALSPIDNSWYRGRLVEYKSADIDSSIITVDVYFVDYGDSYWLDYKSTCIQSLSVQFYGICAQAIECYTTAAHLDEKSKSWSERDCDKFEKLSFTGEWKQLNARRVAWKQTSSLDPNSELPVIQLIDTNAPDMDLDVVAELMDWKGTEGS